LEPGHIHDDQGQARLIVRLGAGVLLEKLSGGYSEAILQPQDIIRGEDNGGPAAAFGEARDVWMTTELEATFRREFPGLHHPHIQINHAITPSGFFLVR
jgi:hypothetical protein